MERVKHALEKGKKTIHTKSITRRWLYNSLGLILVIMVLLEIAVAVAVSTYYYSSARQAIHARVNVTEKLLLQYKDDPDIDLGAQIKNMVETFTDKDKMEMMTVKRTGEIITTSSGFTPSDLDAMDDFKQASSPNSEDGYGEFVGKTSMGEKIIAVTKLTPDASTECYAIRYVASLTNVDNQIRNIILSTLLIELGVLTFIILSNYYFINSIVRPVREIGRAARRIASGDFKATINKQYDDEIGRLCDTINDMAKELSVTEQVKNDFISSVSHELRTPLTAIKGWSETLAACGPEDTVTLERGMKVIESETERLSSMVEELLDFSRMQSGRFSMNMTKLDILAELGEAYLMFTERAKSEGIRMVYNEPEMLSPVLGDKNRLRQVFINILDNALKYSSGAGGTVTIDAYEKEDFIYIVVRDTGVGISKEDLPKIKEKFYKANHTVRGSGIGLAVADEIVALHHGEMLIDSELNLGTTVTIKIPTMLQVVDEMGQKEGKNELEQ